LGLPSNLAAVEDNHAKPAAAVEAPKQPPKAVAAAQGRAAR
jgi:hypothetical protein